MGGQFSVRNVLSPRSTWPAVALLPRADERTSAVSSAFTFWVPRCPAVRSSRVAPNVGEPHRCGIVIRWRTREEILSGGIAPGHPLRNAYNPARRQLPGELSVTVREDCLLAVNRAQRPCRTFGHDPRAGPTAGSLSVNQKFPRRDCGRARSCLTPVVGARHRPGPAVVNADFGSKATGASLACGSKRALRDPWG